MHLIDDHQDSPYEFAKVRIDDLSGCSIIMYKMNIDLHLTGEQTNSTIVWRVFTSVYSVHLCL